MPTDRAPRRIASQLDIKNMRRRLVREAEILAGSLPSTDELYAGYPLRNDSMAADALAFFGEIIAEMKPDDPNREIVKQARATISFDALRAAAAALNVDGMALGAAAGAERRIDLYLALRGDRSATPRISQLHPTNRYSSSLDRTYACALAAGLERAGVDIVESAWTVAEIVEQGLRRLDELSADVSIVRDARAQIQAGELATSPVDEATAEILALVAEDRSEFVGVPGDPDVNLVVVPKIDIKTATSGSRKDVLKSFEPVVGLPLQLVAVRNLAAVRHALVQRFPHFEGPIDTALRSQASRSAWLFRALLVGPPGCGKTAFARALADAAGLPSVVYNCGGASDAAFAGTSAQWSTARASTPLQAAQVHRIANPLIVLDEVEKVGTGKHNGNLADALLGYLEPSSSRRMLDLALEVEVDLSAVSYIATANSLDDVPAPLRDRLTVIRMPDPAWRHVGELVCGIVADIAVERGLDPRWIEPLAPDEFAVIKRSWTGGSIRRLRRAVEILIDGRDSIIARA